MTVVIKKKLNKLIIAVVLSILLAQGWFGEELTSFLTNTDAPIASPSSTPAVQGVTNLAEDVVTVVRVIDGDTIEIEGGQRVRYIGIDTPESKDPNRPVECFSSEATNRNQALVAGKAVQLEKDVSETDRYGRLLRYVHVDGIMVNEVLVREGFAQASAYPPDIKHQATFTQAEREAREQQKGLWGAVCSPKALENSI